MTHALFILVCNALGLVNTGVAALAVHYGWSYLWFPLYFFGWLAVLAYIAMPMIYDKAYRDWLDSQDKLTNPATIVAGICVLGWMVVHLMVLFPTLSVG